MKLSISRLWSTSGNESSKAHIKSTANNSRFSSSKKIPLLYDGDLYQSDRILTWLTSQDVFEIKNEIEDVNRKMLDKLLDENDFLAVFFCKF